MLADGIPVALREIIPTVTPTSARQLKRLLILASLTSGVAMQTRAAELPRAARQTAVTGTASVTAQQTQSATDLAA